MKRVSFLSLTLLLISGTVTLAEPPSDTGRQTPRANPVQPHRGEADSYLGVQLSEVTSESVRRLNLREERGAILIEVLPDSPAAKAGLQKDDVIIRWNGERVDSAAELSRLKRETPAGRTVRLGVVRNGSEMDFDVALGQYSDYRRPLVQWSDSGGITRIVVGERGRMGISLQNLTPQLAEYFGMPGQKGALVSSVHPDSPAAKAGIKAGDVILSVDGDEIENPYAIMRALRRNTNDPLDVRVMRDRQEMTFTVQVEKGGSSSNLLFDGYIDSFIVQAPNVVIPMPEITMPRIEMPEIVIPRIAPVSVPIRRIEIPPVRLRLAPRYRIQL